MNKNEHYTHEILQDLTTNLSHNQKKYMDHDIRQ